MERLHINRLVNTLGACSTDNFSRKNTHLICCKKEGPKYDSAQKWGIPVVTAEWLYKCAEKKLRLPLNDYFLNRDSIEAPQNELPSSETQGNSNVQVTLDVNFSKNLSRVLESSSRLPSKSTEDSVLPHDSIEPPLESTSQSHISFFSDVLIGVCAVISQRLVHKHAQLSEVAESLGARCLWEIDKNCTHYIHQGTRTIEMFKEFKKAKQLGAKIVSPQWLYSCKDQRRWLEEDRFPHTLVQGLQLPSNFDKPTKPTRGSHVVQSIPKDSRSKIGIDSHLPLQVNFELTRPDENQGTGFAIDDFIERIAKDSPSLKPHKFVRRSKSIQLIDRIITTDSELTKIKNVSEFQDTDIVLYESVNFSSTKLFDQADFVAPSLNSIQESKENIDNRDKNIIQNSLKRPNLISQRCFLLSAFTDPEKARYSDSKYTTRVVCFLLLSLYISILF